MAHSKTIAHTGSTSQKQVDSSKRTIYTFSTIGTFPQIIEPWIKTPSSIKKKTFAEFLYLLNLALQKPVWTVWTVRGIEEIGSSVAVWIRENQTQSLNPQMRQDTQDTCVTCDTCQLHWANMANDITNFAAIHKHSQLLLQTGGSLYMCNEYITSVFQ